MNKIVSGLLGGLALCAVALPAAAAPAINAPIVFSGAPSDDARVQTVQYRPDGYHRPRGHSRPHRHHHRPRHAHKVRRDPPGGAYRRY